MKPLKIFGVLTLALLLLVSFTVVSTAQDKKQDKPQKTVLKGETKKVDKAKVKTGDCAGCPDMGKKSECPEASKTGKVFIKKAKSLTGVKDHDCTNCSKEGHTGHQHKSQCDHDKDKKGEKKEKK
jgi:hypothetical protein